MQRFKVIKIDGTREKQLIFRAETFTEQGTRFIFWDDNRSYVDEFEKSETKYLGNFETNEQIFPPLRRK